MSVVVAVIIDRQWAVGADRMWTAHGQPPCFSDKLFQVPELIGAFGVVGNLGACQLFKRLMFASSEPDPVERMRIVWEQMMAHPICSGSGEHKSTDMLALYCGPARIEVLDPFGGMLESGKQAAIGIGGPVALGAVTALQLHSVITEPAGLVREAVYSACAVLPHECGGSQVIQS